MNMQYKDEFFLLQPMAKEQYLYALMEYMSIPFAVASEHFTVYHVEYVWIARMFVLFTINDFNSELGH